MCRLLLVRSKNEFGTQPFLKQFAAISKHSKEYQGHGWGCSLLKNDSWVHYRTLTPVWDDDLDQFGDTRLLIAHARSAFRDEGITVENNMPFFDDRYVFVFNGELRGVKISSEGRIGAEKIFNFVKRFDNGNTEEAICRATGIIKKKTKYIRAMNFIIADADNAYVYSHFNEDPDYFTLKISEGQELVICSSELGGIGSWKDIENDKLMIFQ